MTEIPIYKLGSPDPAYFVRGKDKKWYIGENTECYINGEQVGYVQMFSVESNIERKQKGSLTFCYYEPKDLDKATGCRLGEIIKLKIIVKTEDKDYVFIEKKVQFVSHKTGLSIDDMVGEYIYFFEEVGEN